MDIIGREFTVHHQPYGTYTMRVASVGSYNGGRTLTGIVVRGTETARLFQYSSTRDITGQQATVYGVKDWELERGNCTRVAC